MPISPASPEVDGVRRFIRAHNLGNALDNLPPAIHLTVTPQTVFPSEHPFKLLIGTHNGQQCWIGLGTTPKNGYGPMVAIYVGSSSSIKRYTFDIVDDVELAQPFKRLWQRTSVCTGAERWWKDMRRGALKSLGYWYLLVEAERVGRKLPVPSTIRKYFVEALNKVGTETYTIEEHEARDCRNDGELTYARSSAEVLPRRRGRPLKIESDKSEQELQRRRADLKRALRELDSVEEGLERRDRRAKQIRMKELLVVDVDDMSGLSLTDARAHREALSWPTRSKPQWDLSEPSTRNQATRNFRIDIQSDLEHKHQNHQSKARAFEHFVERIPKSRSTSPTSLLERFHRPVQSRPPSTQSDSRLVAHTRLTAEETAPGNFLDNEVQPKTMIVRLRLGSKTQEPTTLESTRAQEPSSRGANASSGGPAQVDGLEFYRLKQMMDLEAALKLEYQHLSVKAERVKLQLEEQRDAIRRTMAEVVAAGTV